jgi:hypothetical protein
MDNPTNTFDLSSEQRDTVRLLDDLLGQAIAARYEDFCRLSSGAFALNVSKPMAAHALRELDSMLRGVLAVPMEAIAVAEEGFQDKLNDARKQLRALKFDDGAVTRAVTSLAPRINHKAQIQKIGAQLGLAQDGDIAKKWIALTTNVGAAHGRSFHRSLNVDDDFRERFQEPFDTVIRAVVVALRSRYTILMRRVETLASSTDYSFAVKAFANEIPGAMPLQWHFFQHLETGDWLPHLIAAGLIAEPLALTESPEKGRNFGPWPLGHYLLKMAKSANASTRENVVKALRLISASNHPAILTQGIVILAALPPSEAAGLANLAVAWLSRDVQVMHSQAPNDLVKNLATGNEPDAALRVARELLRLWGDNGKIESHYSQHMYEHHLPFLMSALTAACGKGALQLVVDLLDQAETISGKSSYSHLSMQPVTHSNIPPHDICDALLTATREAAEGLVNSRTVPMRDAIKMLTNVQAQIFVRLSLHLLAQDPASAPEEATHCLLDKDLITQTWCNAEYAALANAWFPSMTAENQTAVLCIVDAVPDEHLAWWKARFEEQQKTAATLDDEQRFRIACVAELLWKWRGVLPPERQEAVTNAGDPDAWRWNMEITDESPLAAADFNNAPIDEVVAFLRDWRPEPQGSHQTVTGLAQDLRTAVVANPKRYSDAADQFSAVKPIYVRRLLEGLQQTAANQSPIDWANVLRLIAFIYSKGDEQIGPAILCAGDDQTWAWTRKAASQLLVTGLRLGVGGIPTEHADAVRSLVATALALTPNSIDVDDFDEKFDRQPYFTAQETSRGIAVELCVLLVRWLNMDTDKDGGALRAAFSANPEIAQTLEAQLADHSPAGRIPRAIMGRYMRILEFNDGDWLRTQMPALFPADDRGLRNAAWYSHIKNDGGPISELTPELRDCYLEEATRLSSDTNATDGSDRHFRRERFATYVMVLMLRGILPERLLEEFERHASSDLRRHAMWYVGNEVSRPASEIPDDARARGLAYWERRLAAATAAAEHTPYGEELGVISHWCFHGIVDELWLSDQLLALFEIGLAPRNGHGTVEWLQKLATRHVDRAVEVLWSLICCPGVERWTYITDQAPVRFVLGEGRDKGTPVTVARVREAVSFLATVGGSYFMDLDPPASVGLL